MMASVRQSSVLAGFAVLAVTLVYSPSDNSPLGLMLLSSGFFALVRLNR